MVGTGASQGPDFILMDYGTIHGKPFYASLLWPWTTGPKQQLAALHLPCHEALGPPTT